MVLMFEVLFCYLEKGNKLYNVFFMFVVDKVFGFFRIMLLIFFIKIVFLEGDSIFVVMIVLMIVE